MKIDSTNLPAPLDERLDQAAELMEQGESPGVALQQSRLDLAEVMNQKPEAARYLLQVIQEWYLNDQETEAAVRGKLMQIAMSSEDVDAQIKAAKELRNWVKSQEQRAGEVGGILAGLFSAENMNFLQGIDEEKGGKS